MTKSKILLVMIGGMATVSGAVLAAYIGFLSGQDPVLKVMFAKYLLAASVMAALGAIVIQKCYILKQKRSILMYKCLQKKLDQISSKQSQTHH